MTKKSAPQQIEKEDDVTVSEMSRAREIATILLGTNDNNSDAFVNFVEELYEYLQGTEDEDTLLADFKQSVEDAKEIYKTSSPTPRMVLGSFPDEGVFKKKYPDDFDDE